MLPLLPGEERSNATPSPTSGPPIPSSSKQTPTEENVTLLGHLSVGNVANTMLQAMVGSGRPDPHASGPIPDSSKQTPSEENAPLLGNMISVENVTDTLLGSIIGSGRSESHASGPMPGSSKQTPSEENAPLLGDMVSVENVTNTLLRSILGGGRSESHASGPMPGSSKQTPSEENAPLLGDLISVEKVTDTLLGSILGSSGTGFESQVTAATGPISPGALISQFYNRPETSRSSSNGSQSSGIKDYGAISKGGIGIAYKILEDGSDGNESVTANILGSGIKLAETALTWPFELFNLVRNSAPLIMGFLLQHSLTLASVFSAGQLGKDELAAVSLATMMANLTGYALYQGFMAALETLCAQSYDAGQYSQVGLHFQRCVILLMLTSIPICFIWMSSPSILGLIVQEQKVVDLAGGYLQILVWGAPGYAIFEAGKRYMQVQGIPHASTAVMAFLAPLNACMNFALVWGEFLGLGFGFYGAPLAVVITNWLMPLCLAYYAIFIEGSKCWHPLTLRVFTNWGPILSLALPGIAMIWSQFISVELLTLFSSYFGTSTMAAQSILTTMMSFISQLPFGMSISSCTAVAQYVSAGNITSARRSAYVAMGIAIGFGVIDYIVLIAVREHAGKIFSRDKQVIASVAEALPICAAFQVVDILANVTGGILKGQGRQRITAMVQVPAYYGLAIPVSLYTSFKLGWGIRGLWAGCACALAVIAMVQTVAVLFCDWEKAVREAGDRAANANTEGGQEDVEDGVRERLGFGRG